VAQTTISVIAFPSLANNIIDIFPNIQIIVIRILYLTIPVANCIAERTFSKISRIKNKDRSLLLQDNLTSLLMILATENDIRTYYVENFNFEHALKEFASQKA